MKVNHRRPAAADVYTVTNAPIPLSKDINARQRRYLMSMSIRTVCFVGAVVSGMAGAPLWAVGALVAGAVFLPYISVVVANGGREPQPVARFSGPETGHQNGISGQRPEIGS